MPQNRPYLNHISVQYWDPTEIQQSSVITNQQDLLDMRQGSPPILAHISIISQYFWISFESQHWFLCQLEVISQFNLSTWSYIPFLSQHHELTLSIGISYLNIISASRTNPIKKDKLSQYYLSIPIVTLSKRIIISILSQHSEYLINISAFTFQRREF